MKRILITGFSGFVASHFVEYLYNEKLKYEICGIDIKEPEFDYSIFYDELVIHFQLTDMTQIERIRDIVMEFRPNYVLHLAAFSSVAYSWRYPSDSFMNNSNIFLNLISVVRDVCPDCRILSVGSSEEYGKVAMEDLPVKESQPVNPTSPYAVARVSQEMLSKVFVEAYGMQIIMTRSFNHFGPRQDDRFVVPGFIKRILNIKSEGRNEGLIEVGDLSIVRDFVDVRDVVNGYYLLLINGVCGDIYNICSGYGIELSSIIEIISKIIGVKIKTKVIEQYLRPNENKIIIGNPDKMQRELGWVRKNNIEKTISDMISYELNHIQGR